MLLKVVGGNCVGGIGCASARAGGVYFQACSFIRLRSSESSASYGEMSRRSGEAAKEDNHSDISPFQINDLRPRLERTDCELCQTSECAAIT
jgi:hypothetical protein